MNRNRNPGRKWIENNLSLGILQSALRKMWRHCCHCFFESFGHLSDHTWWNIYTKNIQKRVLECYSNIVLHHPLSAQLHLKVGNDFKVARLQVLKLGCPQCKHDLYWFFKAVGNGQGLKFKIWKISSQICCVEADAEVSSWFLWMSSMQQCWQPRKSQGQTLWYIELRLCKRFLLPWDRPKVQSWHKISEQTLFEFVGTGYDDIWCIFDDVLFL